MCDVSGASGGVAIGGMPAVAAAAPSALRNVCGVRPARPRPSGRAFDFSYYYYCLHLCVGVLFRATGGCKGGCFASGPTQWCTALARDSVGASVVGVSGRYSRGIRRIWSGVNVLVHSS